MRQVIVYDYETMDLNGKVEVTETPGFQVSFYCEPGHGYMAVKREILRDWNILHKISQCSYQSATGKTVYLEEDCDARIFTEAAKSRGVSLTVKNVYRDQELVRRNPYFKV